MENVCDLQRTGTLKMQGFKRSTRPNLQSLREWLQHVATHPSLIKLPWVPAAEELWQQWPQPAGDPGGLVRQLAQPQIHVDVAPRTLAHLETELGGVCTSCGLWRGESGSLQPPATPLWGHLGTIGVLPSVPITVPSCPPEALGYSTIPVLRLEQLSAFKNHQPGCRKPHWL